MLEHRELCKATCSINCFSWNVTKEYCSSVYITIAAEYTYVHPGLWPLGVMRWDHKRRLHSCSSTQELGPRVVSLKVPSLKKSRVHTSLVPGMCCSDFQSVNFENMLQMQYISNYYEIPLGSVPQNTSDDKSTPIQVMVWCRQVTSHYLSQYWPRSMSPYKDKKATMS